MADKSSDRVTARHSDAHSLHSSRMTDAASEDGDEYYPEGAATRLQAKPRKRSPTESTRPTSPPHSLFSRRGSGRRGFGGPGLSMANSNRIQNLPHRNSLTNVPTLTPQAFFRPMSSQRLQAQRGTRPNTAAQEEVSRPSTGTLNRPSVDSNQTISPRPPRDNMIPMPPSSRGTDYTENDIRDRAFHNASPTGNHTIQSATESTRPLQGSSAHPQVENDQEKQILGFKAPTPFRSNFLRSSRQSPAPVQTQFPQNDRYSNDTNSPNLHEKSPVPPKSADRNYEYFSGNTAFCWGGRLQNTRDRPINIITGSLVITPAVLFFVFELEFLILAQVVLLTLLEGLLTFGIISLQHYRSSLRTFCSYVYLLFFMHQSQIQE